MERIRGDLLRDKWKIKKEAVSFLRQPRNNVNLAFKRIYIIAPVGQYNSAADHIRHSAYL